MARIVDTSLWMTYNLNLHHLVFRMSNVFALSLTPTFSSSDRSRTSIQLRDTLTVWPSINKIVKFWEKLPKFHITSSKL